MIADKVFEHKPITELMSIVRNDFRKFDQEGLIDDGTCIKTIMYCNERLGIQIREIREVAIPVDNFKAKLPVDFEKLYFAAALECSNGTNIEIRNPFDNNFDQDVIYKACLNRDQLGCVDNYQVVIERKGQQVQFNYHNWTQISVGPKSHRYCQIDCPNKRKPGKYQVEINGDYIETPFRTGTLYIMYVGMMKDEEGNITFPFHPMITPYYEWSIKEKIITDAIFNSDGDNLGELFKLAQQERGKAWIDAFNFTSEPGYGHMVNLQRKKELGWYNQYFKYFQ